MSDLTNHLWQSTFFAILASLLAVLLRRNQAKTRYWLWLAASMKFLIPFSMLVSLGTHVEVPAVLTAVPVVAVEQMSATYEPITMSPIATASPLWPQAMLTIWAAGVFLLLMRWLRSWLTLRAAVRSAARLHIDAPIPILSSHIANEPGIFGVFRPVLLLPHGITNNLTTEELDAILAHELAHVRRRDNLTAALHMLVETIFWFHPLVWWIGAKLVQERENACDEAVLSEGKQPDVYAQGIVNVCKHYLASPLPCASGVTGADLRKRITTIMTNHSPSRLTTMRKALLACACIGVIATPVTIGLLRAQNQNYTFEVATIRPSAPGITSTNIDIDNLWFRASGATIPFLIQMAYGIQPDQLSGIQNWMRDERFDITAKYDQPEDGNIPPGDQSRTARRQDRLQVRLRNLLAERFQLKLREEIKDLPMYSLKVESSDKLKPVAEGRSGMTVNGNIGSGILRAEGVTMSRLVGSLSRIVGRSITDDTGLEGLYTVELEWSDSTALDKPLPSFFTALKERLGLRLDSTKGPVKSYVIEKLERPSEN